MRKLNDEEIRAARVLMGRGSICLGDAARSELGQQFEAALNGLVRKRRATVELNDDGPVFRLTAQGIVDAA